MTQQTFVEVLIRIQTDHWPSAMDTRRRAAQVLAAFERVTRMSASGNVQGVPPGMLDTIDLAVIGRLAERTMDFRVAEDAAEAVDGMPGKDHEQIVEDGKVWADIVLKHDMLGLGDDQVEAFRRMINPN